MVIKNSPQNSESKSSSSLTPQNKSKKLNLNVGQTQQELEEKLVQDHYGLVITQALSFLGDSHFDDYVQNGLIGLLKAVRNHDPKKSKFSTFATVCIRNEIINLKRKLTKKSARHVVFNSAFVDEIVKTNGYNKESNIKEFLPDSLSEEEKFIIKLKLQNYTNKEISDFISCSRDVLLNKIRNIISIIKEHNE
jgi:RNA polymerase sigma factor (sigma-70 family)